MRRSKALILPHFARKENDNQKACYFLILKKDKPKPCLMYTYSIIYIHIFPFNLFGYPSQPTHNDHLPKTC